MVSRRNVIIGSAAAVVVVAGAGWYLTSRPQTGGETGVREAPGATVGMAQLMAPAGGWVDHAEGADDAPVVVVEYASPTCPHCAAFHNDVYPEFKQRYIDTGLVKFILRPMLRGGPAGAIDGAVFMVADASGESFHDVVATYFRTQNVWAVSNTPRDALFDVAEQLGFTQESFASALTNQSLFEAMNAVRDQALNDFGLTGTPTFYINGKQVTGDRTVEELAAEIDPLLPAGMAPAPLATDTAPADVPATPAAPAASPVN